MDTSVHTKFDNSIVLPELANDTIEPHLNLRPKNFDEYPGQERVCENLKVYTQAAKLRGKMLDHCLFHGPPGLGKTTLAGIVAETMGYQIKVTSGPVIERAADLMGILASIESKTILFIDEIHRLPSNVEEILYSAMEDMRLDILIGQGPTARTVKFDLPPFCIIGATTKAGAISAPLRDRFGIQEHLDFYSPESLTKILMRSAKIMNAQLENEAAFLLSTRCRGTPRIANQLLKRILDFALVSNKISIDCDVVNLALKRLGVDSEGLCIMDRDFLKIMKDRYQGGPVGLDAIAAALNEEKSTLEDVYEPYLVYRGFVLRTARGRMLSDLGKNHLDN
ncbi:Holliday junction branch migration DNA helicase RuvB [Silvanigrella paludirubra]|uniref:Holliday junction branch migration complex subunit RuvB n=1 Tax=Silvanigrella paludirubra TaxID=2499159 RepID=A0A6N6VVN1_9BACT|nr:Holliday junction branch migration DNA helicase RuvB [Silvanigrella paludirubra]KAB8040675.1 Holliday junction branch migration DNA helicase RuvB [Silvanigrella paludirubra]